MANFYKINKDYINTFGDRVIRKYKDNYKRSETSLFKALLEEINELFKKFGGKLSSKRNIPAATDYPDSITYNKLLTDINFDLDKLYNAQKLIESDVTNLLNFNSNQRIKIFEELVTAQQEVYSAYIKSKRDTIGGTEIPAGSPFISADNLSSESTDVYIDEERGVLTLATIGPPVINRDVDIKNISIYFIGSRPIRPIYPLGDTLGVGSHWKTKANDPHFIDSNNISAIEEYKSMMIDDPDANLGIGYCEFEAVRTHLYGQPLPSMRIEQRASITSMCGNLSVLFVPIVSQGMAENSSTITLKEYIGQTYGKDAHLIYLDTSNSLQGEYIITDYQQSSLIDSVPKYKLVVPFITNILTNEIVIDLAANSDGYFPTINWLESKVYSKIGNGEAAYSIVPSSTSLSEVATNGRHVCRTSNFVYPTRLELVLEYTTDSLMWIPIDFYMAHYTYSAEKTYEMPYYDNDSKYNIVLKKTYDIFVDKEASETNEKTRALNVLRSSNGELT